jgi:hypothetical protein
MYTIPQDLHTVDSLDRAYYCWGPPWSRSGADPTESNDLLNGHLRYLLRKFNCSHHCHAVVLWRCVSLIQSDDVWCSGGRVGDELVCVPRRGMYANSNVVLGESIFAM